MKLPIQAQPVMRKARTSDALMSGVKASECNWTDCGKAATTCAAAALGGPIPFAGCLASVGAWGCGECYWDVVTTPPGPTTGPGNQPD